MSMNQIPNRRCAYCGDGLICEHGYCDCGQSCPECRIHEERVGESSRFARREHQVNPDNQTAENKARPHPPLGLRDPSPQELASPLWNAVWQAIKGWDIGRSSKQGIYSGATGTDVCTIFDALSRAMPARSRMAKEMRWLVGKPWPEEINPIPGVESGAHPPQDALQSRIEELERRQGDASSSDDRLWYAGAIAECEFWQAGARSTPSLPAQDARLFSLLLKICRNAYACSYQQNTFPGESDPCGQCANCMADEVLGVNWKLASGSTPIPLDPPPKDAEQQLTDIAFYPRSANPPDRQLVVYLGDAIDILARTAFPRPQQEAYNNLNVDRYHVIQDLQREVERLREALRELVEKYDATISMCPAEFVSNSDGQEFEAVIERGRAALAPSLPMKEISSTDDVTNSKEKMNNG